MPRIEPRSIVEPSVEEIGQLLGRFTMSKMLSPEVEVVLALVLKAYVDLALRREHETLNERDIVAIEELVLFDGQRIALDMEGEQVSSGIPGALATVRDFFDQAGKLRSQQRDSLT